MYSTYLPDNVIYFKFDQNSSVVLSVFHGFFNRLKLNDLKSTFNHTETYANESACAPVHLSFPIKTLFEYDNISILPKHRLKIQQTNLIPAICFYSDSFVPIHKGHLNMLEEVKKYINNLGTHEFLATYISPAHSKYVSKKLKPEEMIGVGHRLSMINLAIENLDWVMHHLWKTLTNVSTDVVPILSMMSDTYFRKSIFLSSILSVSLNKSITVTSFEFKRIDRNQGTTARLFRFNNIQYLSENTKSLPQSFVFKVSVNLPNGLVVANEPRFYQQFAPRISNNLFRRRNQPHNLVVIDWQTCSRANGLIDLVFFLRYNNRNQVRLLEPKALEVYHQILVKYGVSQYSLSQIRNDYYSLALPFMFINYNIWRFPGEDRFNEMVMMLEDTITYGNNP
ncbi:unnamed protein product [Adineta steineri]|uniref:Cytidyltransferase-like domain-containing protein n=1 Tax=Adineta steineri TaxID=433720 RepID=A0A814NQG3_9BILA|nr:unnamed protein product [Adineta steineri]CAF1574890.1 unnamed protein product [Adineta steineri]